ncbi:MAG: hypothetical protein DMF31_11955 [Verrucomicrobia bacterium]|nr:MAG: hypothetical protein DMF31_11955 [Verrucomicrobiota bacterium]
MLFCGLVLVGEVHAQEVIVAREKKPEPPKEEAPPPSEQAPSESPALETTKPKSRTKKSTGPTLEQMREAGALAAERRGNRSPSESNRTSESGSDAPAASKTFGTSRATVTPMTTEPRAAPTSTPRRSSSRSTKPEPAGAVRPSMMESGRQEPSATPSAKGQTPAP